MCVAQRTGSERMTDKRLIEEIKNAVGETFESYGVNKTVKFTKIDPYKRMEQILYNYGEFENIIREKEKQIEEVLANGLPQSSKGILEYHPTGGSIEGINIEEETIQAVVRALQEDIVWVRQVLQRIEYALDGVKNETGYDILRDYYFNGLTVENLIEKYKLSKPTILSKKSRLVRKMAMILFPQDMFYEMMGDVK